jgi:hypothetical protein
VVLTHPCGRRKSGGLSAAMTPHSSQVSVASGFGAVRGFSDKLIDTTPLIEC